MRKQGIYWLHGLLFLATATNLLMAQSSYPFVAADFPVPETLETKQFRLRMLTINDLVKDYDAVMSSVDHLKTVWPDSGWPEGLTLEEDLVDLGWHQKEFLSRRSFAYTVVSLDESIVLGCVYIDPTRKSGYDAEVFLWVREDQLKNGLDANLYKAVQSWLNTKWSFNKIGFPGRQIDWDTWNSLPEEKR